MRSAHLGAAPSGSGARHARAAPLRQWPPRRGQSRSPGSARSASHSHAACVGLRPCSRHLWSRSIPVESTLSKNWPAPDRRRNPPCSRASNSARHVISSSLVRLRACSILSVVAGISRKSPLSRANALSILSEVSRSTHVGRGKAPAGSFATEASRTREFSRAHPSASRTADKLQGRDGTVVALPSGTCATRRDCAPTTRRKDRI